jgi:hypothetical protein
MSALGGKSDVAKVLRDELSRGQLQPLVAQVRQLSNAAGL